MGSWNNSFHFLELAFREVLVAAEQELVELRIKMKDYQVNQSSREKAQRETSRLKGIINSQEKQVRHTPVLSYEPWKAP